METSRRPSTPSAGCASRRCPAGMWCCGMRWPRPARSCATFWWAKHAPRKLSAMKTLVLQHIACEPPGVFEDVLIERGAAITRVELDEGGRLPDWRDFDLIVAMGGPMSVNDESEHPWLGAVKRLVRGARAAGVG